MAVSLGQRKRSLNRRTWPQSAPGQLETIVESPKAPEKAHFQSSSSPDKAFTTTSDTGLAGSKQEPRNKTTAIPSEATSSQMIWYSHHLAQSYVDRERLAGKIEQLESVCKYQSQTNATLLEDIRIWRHNYESAEVELIEATQEMEQAKAYVRSVETANANLRYALSQLNQEEGHTRKSRWLTCIQLPWNKLRSLSRQVAGAVCGASALTTTSPNPDSPSRVIDLPTHSVSRMHLLSSRNGSRSSQLALQVPELRVSTPKQMG